MVDQLATRGYSGVEWAQVFEQKDKKLLRYYCPIFG
jgi:hypothetical protein